MFYRNRVTISLACFVGVCCLLACLVTLGIDRPAMAADEPIWPSFHGPNGDNKSTETGLLKAWPQDGPKLLWKTEGIGGGYAGVTVANGKIYTSGNVDEKTVITAMDLDGKVLWQAENGAAWTRSHAGARGTPTIDGGRIYHENPTGDIVRLDAATGRKVWGINMLDEFEGENIKWALAESLVIDGDRLICCPFGQKASVVALDKHTGRTVWTAPSVEGRAGYATPVLAEHKGLRMVLTMGSEALIGVNADTGELLLKHPHRTKYDVNATTPIFHDGFVFISSGYGTTGSALVKLTVVAGKVAAQEVWGSRELDNHHGGVILVDGYLYGASHNFNRGRWICLDFATGEVKYAEPGVGKGSATFANGMLYTMSENGVVGLVKATPDGHEVISRFELPPGGEGPTWAHPVVCGGRLYLRHDDQLFAYDVKAR